MKKLNLIITGLVLFSIPLSLIWISESRDVRRRASEGRKAKVSVSVDGLLATVNLESEQAPMGFELTLSFDGSILELEEAKLGSLFSGAGTALPLGPKISAGKVMYGGLKVALDGGGVGLGSLAEFKFKARADGVSPLNLLNVTLVDTSGSPIDVELINGQITVGVAGNGGDGGEGGRPTPEPQSQPEPQPEAKSPEASKPSPPAPSPKQVTTVPAQQPEPEIIEKVVEKQVVVEKAIVEGDNLIIRAKGKRALFNWPKMQIWADNKLIEERIVDNSEYRDYSFDVSGLDPNSPVDVVFVNDEPFFWIFSDRALFIDYVKIANLTRLPEEKSVIYDLGKGAKARDGKQIVEGRLTLNDAGSLRFNLKPH